MAVRLLAFLKRAADEDPLVDLVEAVESVDKKRSPGLDWLLREGIALDRHVREGRFQRTLSLIAGIASLLSGLEVIPEHYRGSYSQRVMYTPAILSPALLVAGIWGAFSKRAARTVLPVVSALTVVDGVIGFFMHVRGIHRKPGGWRIPVFNLVMGPPVLAPLLFALSGYLGLIASVLRPEEDPPTTLSNRLPALSRSRARWPRLAPEAVGDAIPRLERQMREGRFQQQLAIAAALSALLSGFEALYSHYKNNFQYRVQWTPIALTPVLFVAGLAAVWNRTAARVVLPIVSILAMLDGAIGTFYHLRGQFRRAGGLTYPIYNAMYGPPLFAPLLFAASGFLGVLASLLRRSD